MFSPFWNLDAGVGGQVLFDEKNAICPEMFASNMAFQFIHQISGLEAPRLPKMGFTVISMSARMALVEKKALK